MNAPAATIIYTRTDEAPALATESLLPIIRAFTRSSGIQIELKDISLAGRILANFPDQLADDQRQDDALAELGALAKTPGANIIKLPNISASIPQLTAALAELKDHGYALPEFPEEPQGEAEQELRSRFARVLGSAVNPVLREGNSDRRVAAPVKQYARDNPHSMGEWSSESKSHVAHMQEGDFFGSEQSHVMAAAGSVRIELVDEAGQATSLKEGLQLQQAEVIDASVMSCQALRDFLEREIEDALEQDVLLSLHLK
ncbi:MAG: NADP-dependent isocitrate dehydrogenase, partial [Verrucomicrobiota bacterium]|nr:NADP-dependent isocitrate dehydrogenase [Verrucomicrobiota bacterium]